MCLSLVGRRTSSKVLESPISISSVSKAGAVCSSGRRTEQASDDRNIYLFEETRTHFVSSVILRDLFSEDEDLRMESEDRYSAEGTWWSDCPFGQSPILVTLPFLGRRIHALLGSAKKCFGPAVFALAGLYLTMWFHRLLWTVGNASKSFSLDPIPSSSFQSAHMNCQYICDAQTSRARFSGELTTV